MKFLAKLEIEAKKDYVGLVEEHAAAALVAEATLKVRKSELQKAIKVGGDTEAILEEIAGGAEAQVPVRHRYLVNDTTVEKLGVILSENPNGVLIFVDELASFLRSMDREGHEADRGFYLTAWSGDSRYTYDRIGRGTLDIEAAVVSIVGSIQPGVVAEHLRSAVSGGGGDDGLVQRFQMAVWPDPSSSWVNVDRYPNASARSLAYEALSRLADLTPVQVGAERDNFERDAVPFLRFEHYAQEAFDQWRTELEVRLLKGAEHPALESHLAKYRSLVPSLALIHHLLDTGSGAVTDASVQAAIGWARYLESHARRLYAGVIDAPAVAARLLAERIRCGELGGGPFAARDVYRHGWSGLDRGRTELAIDVLLALHWLEERTEPITGRMRTVYALNPRIEISTGMH